MFDNKWQKKEMPLVSLIGMGGGIASPAFLASIVLNILKPTVFSPADDTGVPDFDYTAESSAITSVDQVTLNTPSTSSPVSFNSGSTNWANPIYDTENNRVLISYSDGADSGHGKVVIGTINGESIEFGAEHTFANEQVQSVKSAYDPVNHRILVVFREPGSSNHLKYFVGDVDAANDSITWGARYTLRSSPGWVHDVVFDPDQNRMIVLYSDFGDGYKGKSVVGTINTASNSMSIDTHQDLAHASGQINYMTATYLPNVQKLAISYQYADGNDYGYARVGTVNGSNNTITYGSATQFTSGRILYTTSEYDAASGKVVLFYRDLGGPNGSTPGYARVGTVDVNDNTISFGSPAITSYMSGSVIEPYEFASVYLPADQKILLAYQNRNDSNKGYWALGTVNGTSITFGDGTKFADYNVSQNFAVYDPDQQKVVLIHEKADSPVGGRAVVYSPTSQVTQLTLTDTTVSKVSDGSLIGGTSIDQVLTVGETVQADTAVASTVSVPVFTTTLWSGTGSAQEIVTGIDNTANTLLWTKSRNYGNHHRLYTPAVDAIIENPSVLYSSNSNNVGSYGTYGMNGFTENGFTVTDDSNANTGVLNSANLNYVAWNFRAAPGFLDIVTYDGDPNQAYVPQNISHNLGSAPGAMIIKAYSHHSVDWVVYHKELGATQYLMLNHGDQAYTSTNIFNDTEPTDSEFTVGAFSAGTNNNGRGYVAYLFADDTPGLIKCGGYSATGTNNTQSINFGFRPGWLMLKMTSNNENYLSSWVMVDSERGTTKQLLADNVQAEFEQSGIVFTDTGIDVTGWSNRDGWEYVYVAIAENADADITTQSTATGTISASSGNTITLSNTTGTWSTGMKIQGADPDTKDNPDAIRIEDVSLTSSAPTAEKNVNTWGDAVWEIATDENFTQNVQTSTTALSATGTQAGPSFTLERETGYYTRTKYTALGQESEWSDVTYFVTKALPVYADDMFSTYLYTGNHSSQSINNGIDLSGEGGLVWIKARTAPSNNNELCDTVNGVNKGLSSNNTQHNVATTITAFNNDGFDISNSGWYSNNMNDVDYVSWTFHKAPGFFDVVTWNGNGSNQDIAHNLGSVPGFIIVKSTTTTQNWTCYHRSLGSGYYIDLNGTDQALTSTNMWGGTDPTSTHFSVGPQPRVNGTGHSYVAYIFAHDDARFGTNGDESIIKCGSYSHTNGTDTTVDLGFEPQWIIWRPSNISSNWYIFDSMRGWFADQNAPRLFANQTSTENFATFNLTNQGFTITQGDDTHNGIYMAIRRQHKPATVVTDLFDVGLRSGSSSDAKTNSSILTDMTFVLRRDSSSEYNGISSRLMGDHTLMLDDNSNGTTGWLDSSTPWATMTGAIVNGGNGAANTGSLVDYSFKRAPGFFDVVAFTGDGVSSGQYINHSLGVVPEMIIVKPTGFNWDWHVFQTSLGAGGYLYFNKNDSFVTNPSVGFGSVMPTATQFFRKGSNDNANTQPYIAYLFASQPGISKVGSYTAAGAGAKAIDCGFTNGTAFLLVKNVSSSGDWYLLDSERGINAYNETEPYLTLNNKNQEQTANMIGYKNTGFMVNGSSPLNNGNDTYIFLAIANP